MQRYNIETSIGQDWEEVESDDGEYVRYDDHAALCKAVVNAGALADKIMFEDDPWEKLRLCDQLEHARDHMLKLAKEGLQ